MIGRKRWMLIVPVLAVTLLVSGVALGITAEARKTKKATQVQLQKQIDTALPGVVCWGDSITEGMLGEGVTYPGTLQSLICQRLIEPIRQKTGYTGLKGPDVINMGIRAEQSTEIAGRQGGIPFVVAKTFTIPATTTPVEIEYASSYLYLDTKVLVFGEGAVNPVEIAGVKGNLIRYFDKAEDHSKYQFQRLKPGKEVLVPADTVMSTQGSREYANYIPIIAMGSNGGWNSVQDLTQQYQAMLNLHSYKKYVVMGMMLNYDTNLLAIQAQEAYMGQYFGANYMSLRKELNTRGLQIAGITPTAQDQQRIQAGQIPWSLLNKEDLLHYSPTGYAVLGEIVYQKMDALGYFDELKKLAQ